MKLSGWVGSWSNIPGKVSSMLGYNTPKSQKRVGQTCGSCFKVLNFNDDATDLVCRHPLCLTCAKDHQDFQQGSVVCPLCGEQTFKRRSSRPESKASFSFDEEGEEVDLNKSFIDVPLSRANKGSKSRPANRSANEFTQDDDFIVLDSENIGNIAPSNYIPFTVNKEKCLVFLRRYLDEIWFAPSDLDEKIVLNPFSGLYIPFYVISVKTESTYRAEVVNTVEGQQIVYNVSGKTSNSYDELVTCATFSLTPSEGNLMMRLLNKRCSFSDNPNKILPSDPPRCVSDMDFDEPCLPIEMDVTDAFEGAATHKQKIYDLERSHCKSLEAEKPGTIQNLEISLKFSKFEHRIVLLPVYRGSFQYGECNYEVLISGNTGCVEANRPVGSGWLGKISREAYRLAQTVLVENNPQPTSDQNDFN